MKKKKMIKNIRKLKNLYSYEIEDYWSDVKGERKDETLDIILEAEYAYFSCHDVDTINQVNRYSSVTITKRNALRLAKTIMKYYEEKTK